MMPEADSAISPLVEKPATAASEPVASATRNEIGNPIGTVIAIACSTEPVSTPRRTLALFSAKVAADRIAIKPPSTRHFPSCFLFQFARCLGQAGRKEKRAGGAGAMRE